MTAMSRSLTGLGLLAALLGGFAQARSGLVRDWVREWANLGEARQVQRQEERRHDELARRSDLLMYRISAKEVIMGDLFAGRIDLFTAAARFRRLSEPRAEACRRAFCRTSDGEWFCRQVIGWVRGRRELLSPGQAEEWSCRLEADLHRHLEQYGEVLLPAANE
jgi:hypothetical protein